MNNTLKYISEYDYINIKLNKTHNNVNNILEEYDRKYGNDYRRDVKVRGIAKFSDKIKNEKNV